jgi:hypothetical protein
MSMTSPIDRFVPSQSSKKEKKKIGKEPQLRAKKNLSKT